MIASAEQVQQWIREYDAAPRYTRRSDGTKWVPIAVDRAADLATLWRDGSTDAVTCSVATFRTIFDGELP